MIIDKLTILNMNRAMTQIDSAAYIGAVVAYNAIFYGWLVDIPKIYAASRAAAVTVIASRSVLDRESFNHRGRTEICRVNDCPAAASIDEGHISADDP